MKTLISLLAVAVLIVLAGCGERDLNAPRDFFARGKIGSSPDYGIVKFNEPENMVAVVYGFSDADAEMCAVIVDRLNQQACEETGGEGCLNPFSCRPLNTD